MITPTQTELDTARSNSRTFRRREFQDAPRSKLVYGASAEELSRSNTKLGVSDIEVSPFTQDDRVPSLDIEIAEESGGGGLPDGYVPTTVVICDRDTNTAVEGDILFKPAP